jgi:hypothetical protein
MNPIRRILPVTSPPDRATPHRPTAGKPTHRRPGGAPVRPVRPRQFAEWFLQDLTAAATVTAGVPVTSAAAALIVLATPPAAGLEQAPPLPAYPHIAGAASMPGRQITLIAAAVLLAAALAIPSGCGHRGGACPRAPPSHDSQGATPP